MVRYNPPAAWLLPTGTTCLAVLVSLQPLHLPEYPRVAPDFALMAVYHWTIYRPDLLPSSALFVIGVIYDLLTGGRLGMTALLFLISRIVILRSRRWFRGRPFAFIWGGFAILTIGIVIARWAMETVLTLDLVRPANLVARATLMISVFPLASSLLGRAQRALLG